MIYRITLLLLAFITIVSCAEQKKSQEILFVCTHGAARSPIAAAYFNKIAKAENLNYHAVFRGTKPDEVLTKETIAGLTNDAFEIDGWKPEKVSTQDVGKAYKVVTFDCSVPANDPESLEVVEWNGTPSISKDYNVARNAIKEKVEQLVKKLPRN